MFHVSIMITLIKKLHELSLSDTLQDAYHVDQRINMSIV